VASSSGARLSTFTALTLWDAAFFGGFGRVVGHDEGRRIVWHNGGIIGARAMNAVFPDDALAISVRIARLLYAE
jgi:hypothetical protein